MRFLQWPEHLLKLGDLSVSRVLGFARSREILHGGFTTHAYIEADSKMKEESLQRLESMPATRRLRRESTSRLLSFLQAL